MRCMAHSICCVATLLNVFSTSLNVQQKNAHNAEPTSVARRALQRMRSTTVPFGMVSLTGRTRFPRAQSQARRA